MATLPTTAPLPVVRKAAESDTPHLAEALARAFFDDPVMRWIVPDDGRRGRLLPDFFTLYTRLYLPLAEVYVDDRVVGGALWAPPGTEAVGEDDADAVAAEMEELFGADAGRVFELVALLETCHPHVPNYYLQFIGVDPAWQGFGIGSALLTPVLQRSDRERMPAYLDATSPLNKRLYERHGFRAITEMAPASGPPLWPMWRAPSTDEPATHPRRP